MSAGTLAQGRVVQEFIHITRLDNETRNRRLLEDSYERGMTDAIL